MRRQPVQEKKFQVPHKSPPRVLYYGIVRRTSTSEIESLGDILASFCLDTNAVEHGLIRTGAFHIDSSPAVTIELDSEPCPTVIYERTLYYNIGEGLSEGSRYLNSENCGTLRGIVLMLFTEPPPPVEVKLTN